MASPGGAAAYHERMPVRPAPHCPATATVAAGDAAPDLAPDAAYRVLQSHDARFDGRLFVGVTSTGIYCRPVCRVKLPKPDNCRWFRHAAQAELAGFRPCLRCRPELAPGLSLIDSPDALARAGAREIERGVACGEAPSMPAVAGRLGVTDRHFRRIFAAQYGVSPLAWQNTQRLLLAKRLLTDTRLPVTDVAAASGFASLRRFNDAFVNHYRLTPSALRRDSRGTLGQQGSGDDIVDLRIAWRPPYAVEPMLDFLRARALPGVETVVGDTYARTLTLHHRGNRHTGWLTARLDRERGELRARLSASLASCTGDIVQRLRHLFDLDADTAVIEDALAGMPVATPPGLRVPGAMDGFETTMRIILGQQVTVAAARTLAARLTALLGEPVVTPLADLTHTFPTAECIAAADPAAIGRLGIVRARVAAMQSVARACVEGRLVLQPGAPLESTRAALLALPGIGPWTVELVALRVLAWPDAFPASDLGLLDALRGHAGPARGVQGPAGVRPMPADAAALAEAWRPWRSYAFVRLWHTPVDDTSTSAPAGPDRPAARAPGDADGPGTSDPGHASVFEARERRSVRAGPVARRRPAKSPADAAHAGTSPIPTSKEAP